MPAAPPAHETAKWGTRMRCGCGMEGTREERRERGIEPRQEEGDPKDAVAVCSCGCSRDCRTFQHQEPQESLRTHFPSISPHSLSLSFVAPIGSGVAHLDGTAAIYHSDTHTGRKITRGGALTKCFLGGGPEMHEAECA